MAPHESAEAGKRLPPLASPASSVFSHWADSVPMGDPQNENGHGHGLGHVAPMDGVTGHSESLSHGDPHQFYDVADPRPEVCELPGAGLDPRLKSEMEHCFGEDFSGVSVQRGLSADDRSAGVRAVAERERITADSDTLDNQTHPEHKQVLAEELAHVVQKRRGAVVPDEVDSHGAELGAHLDAPHRGALEDEAQHAAARAVAGEKVSIGAGARAPARQFSLWGWVKDNAKGAAEYAGDKLGKGASWLGDKASKVGNWVGDKVEAGGDWLGKKIDKGADWLEDKASKGVSWASGKLTQGKNWLGNSWLGKGASWAQDQLGKGASWASDKLGKGVSWAGDKLGKAGAWIDEKTDQGAGWLGDKIKKGQDWLGHTWLGKGASWVGDKLGKGASWMGDKLGKGASWVGDKLGQGASWASDKLSKGKEWLGNTWLGKGASWVGDKVGKGVSFASDQLGKGVSWAADKLDGGVDWLQDKSRKGTDWLSHTWLGKVGRGIGKVGSALARPVGRWLGKGLDWVEKGRDYLSNGLNKVTSGISRGIDWAEDKVGGAADWMAKKTAGIPILGTMTKMGASYVKFQSQVLGGFVKGGVDLVGGLGNMVLHPVDTVKGLFHLAEHLPMIPGIPNPLKLAHNFYDVAAGNKKLSEALNDTFNPIKSAKDDGKFLMQFGKAFLEPYIQAVKDGKPGEAVGRLGFDVLLLLGTDGAGAVGRGTGETLNAAGKLEQGTKVLNELEKAEQGTKVLSEMEKAEQGSKVLSDAEKAEQGTKILRESESGSKVLGEGEQGSKILKEGEQGGAKVEERTKGVTEEQPTKKKPTGSGYVEEIDPKAEKAYEQIRASKTDVAAISKKTGIPESTLQRIKEHLFVNEHEIATVAGAPPTKQRFVANARWSDLWEGAQKGTLKPAERAELMDLLTHENVEATLSKKGLYLYEPEIVGPGGQLEGRPFKAQGAHDLAGIAERDFRPDLIDKMPVEVRQSHLKDMIKASMEVRGDFPPEMLKNMHPEAQEAYAQILKEREALQKNPVP